MQASRRYTFYQTVRWGSRFILLFLIWDSIPVILYFFFKWDALVIPWQPISLIGIAVAFYLGFKNNSSYERLWEARKIWGGIVNASRTFTVMARDFVTNEFTEDPKEHETLNDIRKTLVHRHVAWLHALTFQLRKLKDWEHQGNRDNDFRKVLGTLYQEGDFEKLKPYLSEEEYQYIMEKGNKASHLMSLQSRHLKELKRVGLIDSFRHMELANMIKEMYTLQGKSERIKNFPFPRQYATVNYFFTVLFVVLLPFAMLSVFTPFGQGYLLWLCIPFSVIGSWVFWTMEMIGDYSENPFEGLYNDVPISSMARGIEIDIRQMLEEKELPKPIAPVGEMKILY